MSSQNLVNLISREREQAGYTARLAYNGEIGLRMIRLLQFDFILRDLGDRHY